VSPLTRLRGATPQARYLRLPRPAANPSLVGRTENSLQSTRVLLALILALATLLRLWNIDALGYNSDEAVYGGQAAAIAGDPALEPLFPAFRAHPLLFQAMVSLGYHLGDGELFGRLAAAALGVATVYLVFALGSLLFGRTIGLVGGLLLALMPYHVVVTRQMLLDGPMVLWATLALYALARFVTLRTPAWLYATAAALGLAFLTKETSIVLVGAVYAFLALTPGLRIPIRHLVGSVALLSLFISAYPLSLMLAGRAERGGGYLAWQLFRRPNHDWGFYPSVVPVAIGLLVVCAAVLGVWYARGESRWKATLLVSWIAVPATFFQLWPVKGFQYLLPIAPAVAVLAARGLVQLQPNLMLWAARRWPGRPYETRLGATIASPAVKPALVALVAVSLLVVSWQRIEPSGSERFLAGAGGLPGGREVGAWIREHVPKGARIMTIGPSLANVIQYYGHRTAHGLAVSPNPGSRNPAYDPVRNPDRLIRDNEIQYLVWDAFSSRRSRFFAERLLRYVDRYHGRAVHSEAIRARTPAGRTATRPLIVVYEVRP
jgi:Dolichyl-phosphate-mannose-protein mannosyltransferase